MKKLRPSGRRSPQHATPRTRLAADIGGTFTDIVAFDEKTGRPLRFEVRERITAEGGIHVALDEASVHAACDRLEAAGVDAVAIMFLHSYVNPAHETRAREIVRERLPRAFVTASHELSREYRE